VTSQRIAELRFPIADWFVAPRANRNRQLAIANRQSISGRFPTLRLCDSIGSVVSQQPNLSHGSGNLRVLHKPTPDISGAQVLSTQQRDADIDTDYIAVDPVGVGIEGINKTINAIDSLTVPFAHST
jgi:hypothetical protein